MKLLAIVLLLGGMLGRQEAKPQLSPSEALRLGESSPIRFVSCCVQPEPMDVPAIIGKDWQAMIGNIDYSDPHEEWKVIDHVGYMRWWTCADKKRILLTAEDGTRHCVSFEGK